MAQQSDSLGLAPMTQPDQASASLLEVLLLASEVPSLCHLFSMGGLILLIYSTSGVPISRLPSFKSAWRLPRFTDILNQLQQVMNYCMCLKPSPHQVQYVYSMHVSNIPSETVGGCMHIYI